MTLLSQDRAWATIDLQALKNNLAQVQRLSPNSKVTTVIKANGYGHGMTELAQVLKDEAGVECLAVAAMEEAVTLNMAGTSKRILLLQGFSDAAELAYVIEAGIESVIHADYQLTLLKKQLNQGVNNQGLTLWLKLDTGMHRLGLNADEFEQAFRYLHAQDQIKKIVIMSHLACADEPEDQVSLSHTDAQIKAFDAMIVKLGGLIDNKVEMSLAASAGILARPTTHHHYVRPGIMLYGGSPFPGRSGADLGLAPVMSLYSRLIAIKVVPAGETIGYGATYTCQKDTRIGIVSIGYGDGYPRSAPNGTPVMLEVAEGFRRSQLLGRVSMDMITIDLSNHTEANVGDRVMLWGNGLPADNVAEIANKISYELFCQLTQRVRFDYLEIK